MNKTKIIFTTILTIILLIGFICYVNKLQKISVLTPTEEEVIHTKITCVYTNGDEDTLAVDLLPSDYVRLNGNGCLELIHSYIPNDSQGNFLRCGVRYFYFQ